MITRKKNADIRENLRWGYIALAVLLILLGTFNNIFSYAAFLLCAVLVIFESLNTSVCLILVLTPIANLFKATPESQSFYTYILLLFVLVRIFKTRNISMPFFISVGLLAALICIQSLVHPNMLRAIKFIANFFVIYFALESDVEKYYKSYFISYIWSTVIASLIAMLDIIPNETLYIGEQYLENSRYEQIRFAGLYGDPNYYSILVIVSLCLIVILWHKKEMNSILAAVLAVALVFFASQTYSKSAFLMLILPLLLLFYSVAKKGFFRAAAVAVLLLIIISITVERFGIFDTVISRFENNDDITTGRFDIWGQYLSFFYDNIGLFFSGSGIGASLINGHAAHNSYIDAFYYFGVIGTVFIGVVLYSLAKTAYSPNRKNFLNYSVLICVAAMNFFLSSLFYHDFAANLIIMFTVLKIHCENEKIYKIES